MSVSLESDQSPAGRTELFLRKHAWWLLLLIAVMMLTPGITTPLIDSDEPRFSGATLEMMERGEWIVPYFNGVYRFDKPPLTYWLQRISFALFGVNEFAARLHTLVTTIGVALLIFGFGRRLYSSTSGFVAGFAWLTCLQVQMHGRAAVADMPMVFCIVLAHRAVLELLVCNTPRRFGRWFWALYLSLGIGFLAKGPVTFVVPVMSLLLFRFVLWRKPLPWKCLQLVAGLSCALAIIVLWGVPALMKTQGLFWKVGIGHHVIDRGRYSFWLETNPFFYVAAAFLSLAPWIACAMHRALNLKRTWKRENAFLIAWLLGPYLIFSFYATQNPHYVMPAFPAFFLLLFQQPFNMATSARWEKAWFWAVLGLGLTGVTVLGFSLALHPLAIEFDTMRIAALWLLGFLFCQQLMPLGWRLARLSWLVPAVLLSAVCMTGFMAVFPRVIPTLSLSATFQKMPGETEFLGFGYSESTMVYYSHHVWRFEDDWSKLRACLEEPGPRCVVCLRREFKFDPTVAQLIKGGADTAHIPCSTDNRAILDATMAEGYQRARFSGLSPDRASWVELEVFSRRTN